MRKYILEAEILALRNDSTDSYFTRCDLTGKMADCYECIARYEGYDYDCEINIHDFADLVNGEYKA